uniref:Orf265_2 n=1 Tax=Solanum tuberosum TaxID=4113 RepID=M0ZGZ3_SOLTU
MTTAPVSHSNPKGKENEEEKEEEEEKVKKEVKEKVKKNAKEKEKKKVKKVEVVSCDVKQQYPFEDTNIMARVKRKNVLTKETTDTKIQKRPRTKTCRKKNENSTTTLLEEVAYEAVSSSQVEIEFSQKEYEELKKEKKEKIKSMMMEKEQKKLRKKRE